MLEKNVRNVALDLLIRIDKAGSFSHLLISHTIKEGKVRDRDEALLTELVYGTMERKITLAYDVNRFIQTKKQIADWVQMLLQLSLYQLRYLDTIPTYAIIDEAVNIAKIRGHKGIASFVNGVLRTADRQGAPDFLEIENEIERLAIETSHPLWLVQRWVNAYGYERTYSICTTNITKKPLALRVNPLLTTRESLMVKLRAANVQCIASPYTKYGIIVQTGNVFKTSIIEDGLATVQDVSSMLAAQFVQVEKNMHVLDCCSAPGGKATFMAERLQQTGKVYAYDIHKNKTKLIHANAKRLNVTNIHVDQHDARKLHEIHENESFDRILIDAPCSGLGIIRTKPDIKYNKSIKDIEHLAQVQTTILHQVAPLLKRNGKMVYSTCTIEKVENEQVVERFLQTHPSFQIDPAFFEEIEKLNLQDVQVSNVGLQIFPQSMNADGFFVTRFVHVGDKNGV